MDNNNGGSEGDERLFGQAFSRPKQEEDRDRPEDKVGLPDMAERSPEARIAALKNPFWIGYSTALEARAKIEALMNQPYTDRINSYAVISKSYNGKTSLFRNIQRKHNILPVGFSDAGTARTPKIKIPVFFMQAPPEPNEERLLGALLRRLNMLGPPREPVEHKLSRVMAAFQALEVKMLEVDEFGFFQAGSGPRQRKALNGLKYLGNELRIPIVLSSVEEGLNIISSHSEIANRYSDLQLPKWKPGDEETKQLLASFEKKLGLRESSGLAEESLARLIIANAESTLGHIHDLLRLLAANAIKTGREKITAQDLTPDALKQLGWVLPSQRHRRIG